MCVSHIRTHISLVIHEACIEVGCLVRIWRYNMRRSTRERILQEMEHGEELARWHEHLVCVSVKY